MDIFVDIEDRRTELEEQLSALDGAEEVIMDSIKDAAYKLQAERSNIISDCLSEISNVLEECGIGHHMESDTEFDVEMRIVQEASEI